MELGFNPSYSSETRAGRIDTLHSLTGLEKEAGKSGYFCDMKY